MRMETTQFLSDEMGLSKWKARFLSQYFLAPAYWIADNKVYHVINVSVLKFDLDSVSVHLKPLSMISDEDADECGYNNAEYFSKHWNGIDSIKVFDYLRSKNYALPFMNWTLDDLVNLGWVKLVEESVEVTAL